MAILLVGYSGLDVEASGADYSMLRQEAWSSLYFSDSFLIQWASVGESGSVSI